LTYKNNVSIIFKGESKFLSNNIKASSYQTRRGSPIMEDIAILKSYDLKDKKDIAKYLAGIIE